MSHPPIQRVPSLLLEDARNKEDYVPKVVSIGPYHHGKEELRLVESFKPEALNLFVSGDTEEISFYLENFLESISEVRKCYDEEPTKAYTDHVLAWMMLLDACLILNRIIMAVQVYTLVSPSAKPENQHLGWLIRKCLISDDNMSLVYQHLGMLIWGSLFRDLCLLENQIPFQIIKLLIELRYGKDEGEYLLNWYMNLSIFGNYREKRGGASTLMGKEEGPLHLLDAIRRFAISDCIELEKTGVVTGPSTDLETGTDPAISQSSCTSWVLSSMNIIRDYMGLTFKEANEVDYIEKYFHSFRSVKDLKAKGIHFKPSPTESLMDVKFTSNFLYAELQLPFWHVTINSKVFFLNIIAYELSPNNYMYGEVISYINLMKSLIERPEDVKELREKRILINMLGSDEEVLNVYKEINTYGGFKERSFHNVREKIQSHYNSKRKTWIAELIHTYFRSPWTVLTFLAAFTLLCLTSIQTYYTVNPKSNK